MDFFIVNGKILRKEDANLTHLLLNEPFVLTQKIWFGFGGIPLFDKNIDILVKQLEVFGIATPGFLKEKRELFRITKRMLNKNKFYRSGIITLQLYVLDTDVEYVIVSKSYSEFNFPLNSEGVLVNFSKSDRRQDNELNRHLFYNRTNWKIKSSNLRNSSFANSILLNEKEMVCEGISSNIFMIKKGVVITPSLDCGCYEDVMRDIVREAAGILKLDFHELPDIKPDYISESDELFFVSEERGIQWVLGVEKRRFVNGITKQIYQGINDVLKKRVEENG